MERKFSKVIRRRKKICISASFLDPSLKAQLKPSVERQVKFK